MCDDDVLIDSKRRRFVILSTVGLAVSSLGSLISVRVAEAKGRSTGPDPALEIPKLPESDKQAEALGYREIGDSVDTTKFARGGGQYCQNCQLYSGLPGESWGPCAVFSYRVDPKLNRNYVVAAKGWCRSWGPRQG